MIKVYLSRGWNCQKGDVPGNWTSKHMKWQHIELMRKMDNPKLQLKIFNTSLWVFRELQLDRKSIVYDIIQ